MALATATVSFDIADQLGNDFDPRRTKVWVTTNVPGDTIVDTTGNRIRLGSGNVTLNADGTGSIVVWVPGAGSNPDSWQTTVHVDYPDRNERNGRGVRSFGPFTITANADLADLVDEQEIPPTYLTTVTDALDGYVDSASAAAATAAAAAASAAASLDAISAGGEGLGALADRIDGVNDHGNVSGALNLSPAKGYHVFDATAPTTVTLGTPPGYSLAFKAISGADKVAVNGLPDLELTDDAWSTFVYYRGSWSLAASGAGGGGGGTVEPVVEPPTQPGAVTVTPTATGYNLSWVASTVAAGYEGAVDGGSYVDYGSNLTEVLTGYQSGSSHSGTIRAYNSNGVRSATRAWGPASVNTLALHDLLMSYSPTVYVRLTDGTVRDYSAVPGTWTVPGGRTAPTFDGPALTPGDTSSARFISGAQLSRPGAGIYGGMNSATGVIIMRSTADNSGSNGLANFNVNWGTDYNVPFKPNQTRVVFVEWDGTSDFGVRYFDANGDDPFESGGHNMGIGAAPSGYPNPLYLHGNANSGGLEGGWLSHLAILPNVLLNQAQRTAIAHSAGTA